MLRYRSSEALLVGLFAAIVIFQLFLPPSIGLANNGDFAKMIGRFSLAPASLDTSDEYAYFTSRWVYDKSFHWVSEDRSSELIPITAAVFASWWFSDYHFDIRALGAIHAALWIACFAAFVPLLRPLAGWRRHLAGIAALFIFTDVSYVAHLNSFYTDVAAFLFLAWTVVLWLHFVNAPQPSLALFLSFGAAAILSVLSKAQHAPLGIFWCALAVSAALLFKDRRRRAWALVTSVLILGAAALSFHLMPKKEKGEDAYAGIFMIVLHNSPNLLDDLRELGLGPEYLPYVGHWPFPGYDDSTEHRQWWDEFNRRTGHRQMVRFVLRHPWRAATIMYRSVHDHAFLRRHRLGNYERRYGRPPGAETKSFGWWSALRSALFRLVPWHIVVWYAAILGAGVWFTTHRRERMATRLGQLAAMLATMGFVELAVSAMGDAGEIQRHLFLFHVITDFTIVLAIVWCVSMPRRLAE